MTVLSCIGTEPNSLPPEKKGVEFTVHGTVQGVGFRPFVYRLAKEFGISGTIANTAQGVVIQAQAPTADLERFLQALSHEAPPLARITAISQKEIGVIPDRHEFTILESGAASATQTAVIPADIALCDDCRRELLDPADRRHLYPFINCTNCGPRFTIVRTLPYDRTCTSMLPFPMCGACRAEYDDPDNRRFHAQPNACAQCGPRISWHDRAGKPIPTDNPVAAAILALTNGDIVAVRGLGGFHLVVDGGSEAAVALLRKRKHRQSKPLAVMVADLEAAGRICHLAPLAGQTLTGPAHPIVLLPGQETTGLAANIAPGTNEIGVMLPYTPLHHLLFATPGCPQALVMTSGNRSGEPLCIGNDEAVDHLGDIADFFLLHNRDIVTRIDDSVIRIMQGRPRLLRRARGYVPTPIALRLPLPPLIACGGGLKNTFCLARADTAFLSQHIGDLSNLESLDFFRESVTHFQKLLQIQPQVAVCDLHPDYLNSRYARESGLPLIMVQHHHAHAVAVMAEHGLEGTVLAIVLDGTGLGPDDTIWGGEILEVTRTAFTRRACLAPLPLPGGDAAAEQPWRMGLAALACLDDDELLHARLPTALQAITEEQRTAVLTMIENGFNTPLTSSCGRLFDAVAALLGIRQRSDFEGQAAMELEAAATRGQKAEKNQATWTEEITERDGCCIIEHRQFFHRLIRELEARTSPDQLALTFHRWLIASLATAIDRITDGNSIRTIVLSGGCLQNRIIMEGLFQALEPKGFQVFTGENVPVNDGGISLGQAVIGGLQYVSGNTDAGY